MQVANKTQLKLEQEKGGRFCLFVQVCVCDVLVQRAYFSSPYSPSSDRSRRARVQALGNRNEARRKREDGRERKRAVRWGRKRMERKEREDRRGAEAETGGQSCSIWNGTKRKELTNEWNQTKGGEVLD